MIRLLSALAIRTLGTGSALREAELCLCWVAAVLPLTPGSGVSGTGG